MADYGLLSGLAQGVNAGLDAYNSAQDRQLRIKQYKDEQEVKKLLREQQERGQKMEMVSKGLLETPEGGFDFSPQKKAEQEADLGYKKSQIQKNLADAEKSKKAALTPEQAKISGELKMKAGGLASSLKTLEELEGIYNKGGSVGYVNSETPFIGGLLTDKPVDVAVRKLADDIGRLRSGGAINKDEESRFRNMLPRAGDSKDIAMQKIKSIREEFLTRSGAIGVEDPQGAYAPKGLMSEKMQPQTKVIGGKQYKKVNGGWEEI